MKRKTIICGIVVLALCLVSGCGWVRDHESDVTVSETLWDDIASEYYVKQEPSGASDSPSSLNPQGNPQGTPGATESPDAPMVPNMAGQSQDLGTSQSAAPETLGDFYITEITDEIWDRINGKSYREGCPVPVSDLRYVHVLHCDAGGEDHEGELVVNVHIAEDVLEIFRQLYVQGYPIEKIRLVDEYGADDELSMSDNNTSCFNYRNQSGSTKVSNHGLGLAVDINPLYNPYIKEDGGDLIVEPASGKPYQDRGSDFAYKIEKGDPCYNLFIEHGFMWGGAWKSSKDYQHFEVPDDMIAKWYPGL